MEQWKMHTGKKVTVMCKNTLVINVLAFGLILSLFIFMYLCVLNTFGIIICMIDYFISCFII